MFLLFCLQMLLTGNKFKRTMLLVKNLIATRICLACAYTQAPLCKIQADGSLPESLQEDLAEDGAAFAAALTNKLIAQIKDVIQVRHTIVSGCVFVCLVPASNTRRNLDEMAPASVTSTQCRL
jgi:hypothetical protein